LADLDAVGNTTKAITKGIAISSAVIAAVSLFGSFITDVGRVDATVLVSGIRVSMPQVFVGMLIGGAIPWLFSSFAIQAVSRAAAQIIQEVRVGSSLVSWRQGQPDYRQAVAYRLKPPRREPILATMAVVSPILVGLAAGGSARRFSGRHYPVGQLLAVF
jgi:K(+)-stimulated pyrophosphate-energized sodium pump